MARGKRQRQREARFIRENYAPGVQLVVREHGTGDVLHIEQFIPQVSNGRFLAEGGGRQLRDAIASLMHGDGDVYVHLQFHPEVKK